MIYLERFFIDAGFNRAWRSRAFRNTSAYYDSYRNDFTKTRQIECIGLVNARWTLRGLMHHEERWIFHLTGRLRTDVVLHTLFSYEYNVNLSVVGYPSRYDYWIISLRLYRFTYGDNLFQSFFFLYSFVIAYESSLGTSANDPRKSLKIFFSSSLSDQLKNHHPCLLSDYFLIRGEGPNID